MDLASIEDASQGRTIVKLRGELDIESAPDLRERLLAILSRQTLRQLVLDLSGLQFIDSSGISVFVSTERRARMLGCTLVLVAPQTAVSRVLHICGLDQYFLIVENIGALAEPGHPDLPGSFRLGLAPEKGQPDPAAT
jgi:anti-sigma B factor antagonist